MLNILKQRDFNANVWKLYLCILCKFNLKGCHNSKQPSLKQYFIYFNGDNVTL